MMEVYLDNLDYSTQKIWKRIKELILLRVDDSDDYLEDIYRNLKEVSPDIILILNNDDISSIEKKRNIIGIEIQILLDNIKLNYPEHNTVKYLNCKENLTNYNLRDYSKKGIFGCKGISPMFISGDWTIDINIDKMLDKVGIKPTNKSIRKNIKSRHKNRRYNKRTKKH